jgi:simple sugar transport system permease protein
MAIAIGLFIGFLIIVIINPSESLDVLFTILGAGFIDGISSFGDVLKYATPIILTGLSVAFAFKTGLFNIGASGQIAIGGVCAIYAGVRFVAIPAPWHWMIAVLFGILGGMLWGALVGLLKAFFNVHEVVSSIMLNYIGMYLSLFIVRNYLYDFSRAQNLPVAVSGSLPKFGLDRLFPSSSIDGGILFAILAGILIYIIIEKTKLGYELKAVGFNKDAANYAGIHYKKNIIISMLIAGGLSGLAAATMFLHPGNGLMMETVSRLFNEGFDGIPVALLALSNPIGSIFSGIFLGYLRSAEFYVQAFDFDPEIIKMIISIIFYTSALSLFLNKRARNLVKWVVDRNKKAR